MRLLIVGGGGREHALAWKLQQSPRVEEIFCAPGNAGTAELGENIPIPPNDIAGLCRFAKENRIALTVVGPDDPLAAGLVDEFNAENLRVFGPTKSAARLEASKVFAKQIMRSAGVPTAMAGVFDDSRKACRFVEKLHYPVVIKADGLAAGKGVVVAQDPKSACQAVCDMIDHRRFGAAGERVLVEEFLEGWECSLHALVDGDSYQLLGTACDHKRLRDGNEGPNTGGMGAYSPAAGWDSNLEKQYEEKIMRSLLRGLRDEKLRFSGLLFPGLMIKDGVARVLEFNCRFGDPETQVILPRLQGDLLPVLEKTIDGQLEGVKIELDARPAVTVVMASAGYPGKVETGKKISGLAECARMENVHVFHAGTQRSNGNVLTNGGRVLAVTALGDTLGAARELAYSAVAKIDFEGCQYRRDIALTALPLNLGGTDVASRS
ncbi:MAG: phosphoribosylamine--glycine ligase [Chthoniobacterales bacterium]|nr:phosphoribosylamine--glycine ligase [Chthoniobacterales bacterium]